MILFEATSDGSPMDSMALMIAIVLAFITMSVMSARSQKKEKARHAKWVDDLPKNTHVVTRSGIHGSVMSVKDNVVVLKVDEEKGVKLTVSKESISHKADSTESSGS